MTAHHSSSSVFMTNKTPSGMKRHCESIELEVTRQPFSSEMLAHSCMTLWWWLHSKHQHLTQAVH